MKRKFFIAIATGVFMITMMVNLSVAQMNSSGDLSSNNMKNDLASLFTMNTVNAETTYSCTVTTACPPFKDKISCTGTNCERGSGYVKCDGNRTEC
ncbi:MAG: hypothetical protein PF436_00480 [Prolixibacteraceae bacterium]|jgi:hypothetical protein|nr:hypothetical protein [Prolixibacteraceae bacterium]